MRPSHVHAKIFEAWETRETSFQAGQSRIRRGPELQRLLLSSSTATIDRRSMPEGGVYTHSAPRTRVRMHVRRHSRHRPKPAYPRNRSYTSGSTLEISQGCGEVCGLLRGGPDCARRSIALRASFFSPESSCLGTVLVFNPPLTGLR